MKYSDYKIQRYIEWIWYEKQKWILETMEVYNEKRS